jgi:hypothetical protein
MSNLHPQLQNRLFYILNFSKPIKLHPEAVLDRGCYSNYGFATVRQFWLFLFLFIFAESLKNHSKS